MDLVEVVKSEVYCDSSLVARKFGMKNIYVVDRIKKVIDDIGDLRVNGVNPKCMTEDRSYRGNEYVAYLMNRDFFSFLIMRFRGKKAVKWQLQFIAAFNAMEEQLKIEKTNAADPEWIGTRNQVKIGRHKEADVIKYFVEYATDQGSKNAKFYYKHITNATYSALGLMMQKKPKLRDTMNIYELSELLLAEKLAQTQIKKYMDLGRDYKDIYESVKDDLINFANGLRIE